MKVRSGFVSNSSSSSFVLIGRKLTDDDLKLGILKNGNMIKAVGHYLADGADVIDIDSPEKLGFVKAVNKLNPVFTIYEGYFMGEDLSIDVEKLKDKLPERGKVGFYSIEQDYHGCTCLEDMFNSYSNYSNCNTWYEDNNPSRNDIEREMQVFLRAKKLKKLNKKQKNDYIIYEG